MATRRLSTGALIVGVLIVDVLGLLWSGPGLAQYMVLTPPEAPAEAPHVVPAPGRPLPPPRPTARILDGELPNQRTGSKHERVVRDICIGCNR